MTYLLDTNTCIHYLNGTSEAIRRHIESTRPHEIVVCSMVKAELFYGAQNSRYPLANLEKQQAFLGRFVSLPFEDQAAEVYGRIRARLKKAGQLIGPNDLIIASIAVSRGCILVTHNTKEFRRIAELEIEDWEVTPKLKLY
ncbi:MAG: PIN domain-containing protein [Chloroflexi bacterium]|jgi:tRNA(fMet)-specific endonuclease VapC|nr:PIN domain-containing protein [Chloroflexota bacterium]